MMSNTNTARKWIRRAKELGIERRGWATEANLCRLERDMRGWSEAMHSARWCKREALRYLDDAYHILTGHCPEWRN